MAKEQAKATSVKSVVIAEQARGRSIGATQRTVLVEVLGIAPDEAEKIVRAITTTRTAISTHRRIHKLAAQMAADSKKSAK